MDEMQELMQVLEGYCPSDGETLEVEHLGGFPEWLEGGSAYARAGYPQIMVECPYDKDGAEINEWTRPTVDWDGEARVRDSYLYSTQGQVKLVCPTCGAEHWVYHGPHGDWTGG